MFINLHVTFHGFITEAALKEIEPLRSLSLTRKVDPTKGASDSLLLQKMNGPARKTQVTELPKRKNSPNGLHRPLKNIRTHLLLGGLQATGGHRLQRRTNR